ncbi:hypothetical protein ACOME3_000458 [Neoechinorhynchus agilis]
MCGRCILNLVLWITSACFFVLGMTFMVAGCVLRSSKGRWVMIGVLRHVSVIVDGLHGEDFASLPDVSKPTFVLSGIFFIFAILGLLSSSCGSRRIGYVYATALLIALICQSTLVMIYLISANTFESIITHILQSYADQNQKAFRSMVINMEIGDWCCSWKSGNKTVDGCELMLRWCAVKIIEIFKRNSRVPTIFTTFIYILQVFAMSGAVANGCVRYRR